MCHENFEIEFNPLITVVTGRNGSGKSAVLTALMVVFGTRSSDTGRGSKASSLILEGKDAAYITATIRLPQLSASRVFRDRYGDEVTIVKRITSKGPSSVLFENANGSRVKINKSADEVREIARHCGFFPSNPMAILTQEASKKFLNAASPHDKYKKVREALRITDAENGINGTGESVRSQAEQRRRVEETIQNLNKKISSDENFLSLNDKAKETTLEINKILAWRQVKSLKDVILKLEQRVTELDPLSKSNTAAINAKYEPQLDKCGQEIRDLHVQITAIKNKLPEERSSIDRLKELIEAKKDEQASDQAEIDKLKKVFAEDKKQLEDLESQQNERSREDEIVSLRKYLQDLRREETTRINDVGTLELEIPDLKTALHNAKLELVSAEELRASAQRQRDEAHKQLTAAQKERRSNGRSREQASVLDQIVSVEPTWSQPGSKRRPKGPLGEYVQVTEPRWSPVLESMLRKTNSAYWVFQSEDHNRLLKHLQRRNINASVYTRRPEVFNFQAGSIRMDKNRYTRVLDVLDFKDPQVQCLYVDLNSIEKVALCDSVQEGLNLMKSKPQNLATVISYERRNGKVITRRISMKHGREMSENFSLFSGTSAMKSAVGPEVGQLEEEFRSYQEQFNEFHSSYKRCQQEVRRLVNKLESKEQEARNLKKRLTEIEENIKKSEEHQNKLLNVEPVNEINLDELRARVSRQSKMVALGEANQPELRNAVREAQQKYDQARTDLADLETSLQALKERYVHVQNERDAIVIRQDKEIRQSTSDANAAEALKSQLSTKIDIEKRALEAAEADAAVKGGGPETALEMGDKSIDELKADLRQLRANSELAHRDPALVAKRRESYEKSLEDRSKAQESLVEITDEHSRLLQAYNDRKQNLEREWQYLKHQSSKNFAKLMRKLNFRGELIFDDKKATLVTKISPGAQLEQGAGTLSGGERSFTQLALIVSVWQCMPINLVAMDEYDVFMDRQTRHRALNMMLSCLTAQHQQCILITPLDLDGATLKSLGNRITICRLTPPRP